MRTSWMTVVGMAVLLTLSSTVRADGPGRTSTRPPESSDEAQASADPLDEPAQLDPSEGVEARDEEPGATSSAAPDHSAQRICEVNPAACQPDMPIGSGARELKVEPVYVVQQIYLRRGRLDVSPYWSVLLHDRLADHMGPGLSLTYYVTNLLGVSLNGSYFEPFNSDSELLRQVQRGAGVSGRTADYQWIANVGLTYVPLHGKFAAFRAHIFYYDVYVVGGIGAVSTRPQTVVSPEYHEFEYKPKVAFHAGLGIRVFMTRWLAAFVELRDHVHPQALVAADPQPGTRWRDESKLTDTVQMQFGLNVFVPPSWTYHRLK